MRPSSNAPADGKFSDALSQAQHSSTPQSPKSADQSSTERPTNLRSAGKSDGRLRASSDSHDSSPKANFSDKNDEATAARISAVVNPVQTPDVKNVQEPSSSVFSDFAKVDTASVGDDALLPGSRDIANPKALSFKESLSTDPGPSSADDDIPASSDNSAAPTNEPSKAVTTKDALLDSLGGITKQTGDGPTVVDKKLASTPTGPAVNLPSAKPAIAESKPSSHENVPAKPILPAGDSAISALQAHTSPQTVKEATTAVTSMGPRAIDTKPTGLHAPATRVDASGKPQTSSVSVSSIHGKNGDGAKGQTSQSGKDSSSLGSSASSDSINDVSPVPQNSDATFNSTLTTHIAAATTQTQSGPTVPSTKGSELIGATPQQVADAASVHTAETASAFAPTGIQAAKLVERMGQSEIRVGIRDGELGNVDIRTSMSHNNFTAQISVERGDLSRVIAAELPSLHSRLSDQRLPVAQITVQNQSSGMSGDTRGGQQYGRSAGSQSTFGGSSEAIMPFISGDGLESSDRLDIHM